ncbi:uncharacterized protein Dmoj_GI25758 [Drosophila mojavensis]|uniref:Uncharacterized protein n=1 Tax=Drosophila mojavensis TaxID=7230 RepID=A0A0Q9XI32_DROMO|nr:uncharacterized protein Dmoj_GI25758 [Drosophila mojavensis]
MKSKRFCFLLRGFTPNGMSFVHSCVIYINKSFKRFLNGNFDCSGQSVEHQFSSPITMIFQVSFYKFPSLNHN